MTLSKAFIRRHILRRARYFLAAPFAIPWLLHDGEAVQVLAPEQDLERPAPSDDTRQPRRWMASRNSSDADFRLTEHSALSACKADVGGENKLTAGGAGSPSDR